MTTMEYPEVTRHGIELYRAGHDVNGNPRYVFHSTLLTGLEPDRANSETYVEHLERWRFRAATVAYGHLYNGSKYRHLGDVILTTYNPHGLLDDLAAADEAARAERNS